MLIVLTTVADTGQGERLAEKIVSERLAACVQILPQMTSVYVWKGNIAKESEHLLLIKTIKAKYEELEAFILANHSYETPEIVAIKPEEVSASYEKWLADVLT